MEEKNKTYWFVFIGNSIVLENDEGENIAELFLADDDTIIIGGDLMDGLDQDLNAFLNKILDEGEDEMKNVKV